ncbi:MAG: hypothetical protein IT535_10905 [Bauldia sp.]|nr:hypothetical protein [Bauldia sp.]
MAVWFGDIAIPPSAPPLVRRSPPSASLRVAGGIGEEAYEFTFELQPDGRGICRWRGAGPADAPAMERASGESEVETPELPALADNVLLAGSRAPMAPPAFPPDSLIGRLEINSDSGRLVTFFMADEEQARTADLAPPDEVRGFTEAVYESCEGVARRRLRP